ncbi:MAG: S-layer domain protein [Bacilli bacterium]|nr:S-layer domain protein [Bacilli bacterium]
MKKKLVIFTMIMSLVMLPVLSYADAALDSKAVALNKLTILQGDGVNFNLTGQLKRSEAITFIVRIMGKEDEVKANAAQYATTNFKDVKSTDWFAPYVGYSAQLNIVNGFPDGGYHPNEFVSEQAFLKLVMGALGYMDGTDFVWDTIYPSSYNLGLVTDVKYKTQTTDNAKYLRSDVVNVLYNALLKHLKISTKTIIDTLIDGKIIDRDVAVQLGLAKAIVPVTIVSAIPPNSVTLNVNMSQAVKALTAQDITIYETDNKANRLTATVNSQVYQNLVITTSNQIPDKKYTLEINATDDATGTNSIATSNFVGLKIPEIVSNYFKISKVVPMSKNVINVYYTQPITSDAALPVYYEITKSNASFVKGNSTNMSVKVLSEQNNVVSIYLKNNIITDDVPYALNISGDIPSAYNGVYLNDGAGDTAAFANNVTENKAFNLTNVTPVDSKTLRLEFNGDIDYSSAKQLGNYQISTAAGFPLTVISSSIPSDGGGKAFLLGLSDTLMTGTSYIITMKNISDIHDQITLPETKYPFSVPTIPVHKDLNIGFVQNLDKLTLKVYFDNSLDATTATNANYYNLTGITNSSYTAVPTKVYFDPKEPNAVRLFFSAGKEMISGNAYKLRALNLIQYELGGTSTVDAIYPSFTTSNAQDAKPVLSSATIISKDTLKVTSQKELLGTGSNVIISNYSLESKDGNSTFIVKTPINITVYDATTLILKFDALDLTKDYIFKFNTLTDITGTNVRSSADGSNSIAVITEKQASKEN